MIFLLCFYLFIYLLLLVWLRDMQFCQSNERSGQLTVLLHIVGGYVFVGNHVGKKIEHVDNISFN